jgi:hypothetical protein
MVEAVREFGSLLKKGGVGLFYFAGHGVQSKGRNYLIPLGASLDAEGDLEFEAMDANMVLAQMDDAGNRVNIVVLDACRNNPFTRSFRSASRGLAQMDAATGSFLAYATAPGSVAADGDGRNGIFTKHLLASLKNPESKVEEVFKRVRVEVARETGNKQIPWDASSLTGDFYFREAASGVAPPPAADPAMLELAFWDSVKDSKGAEEFGAYLEHYPNGRFAGLARARLKSLQVPPGQVALASPTAGVDATNAASFGSEWAQRVALLEKSSEKLTFAKAMAILFDIDSAEELTLLLRHAEDLKSKKYHSSHAIGADKSGNLIWGNSWGWGVQTWATDTAHDLCAKAAGDSCKAVIVDDEFSRKAFIEMAKQFGKQSVASVRQAYMQGLRKKPSILQLNESNQHQGAKFCMASIRE